MCISVQSISWQVRAVKRESERVRENSSRRGRKGKVRKEAVKEEFAAKEKEVREGEREVEYERPSNGSTVCGVECGQNGSAEGGIHKSGLGFRSLMEFTRLPQNTSLAF